MIRRALPWLAVLAIGGALGIALAGGDDDERGDPEAGQTRVLRNTAGAGARLVTGSTPAEREFMRTHYWRMRGDTPFFDQALRWAPPSHVYKDLYALYPTSAEDRALVRANPDWVLRDGRGRKLFIPFACNGQRCAAWAADPGNEEWRAHWLERARASLALGYAGVFVDNVNMEVRVGNADGELAEPVDPRTGRPMEVADWRRYVAEFAEQIGAELPDAEIVHNSIWYADRSDGFVDRQVAAADYVELERGFSDRGLRPGAGRFGFESFLDHIDWVHSVGPSVVLEPYGLDEAGRCYELAGYFLVNDGGDAIAPRLGSNPGNWWPGWEADLGAPTNDRHLWNDVWRRDFEAGTVLLNPPGADTTTVELDGGFEDLDGAPVDRVTLAGRGGIVLRSSDREQS